MQLHWLDNPQSFGDQLKPSIILVNLDFGFQLLQGTSKNSYCSGIPKRDS